MKTHSKTHSGTHPKTHSKTHSETHPKTQLQTPIVRVSHFKTRFQTPISAWRLLQTRPNSELLPRAADVSTLTTTSTPRRSLRSCHPTPSGDVVSNARRLGRPLGHLKQRRCTRKACISQRHQQPINGRQLAIATARPPGLFPTSCPAAVGTVSK